MSPRSPTPKRLALVSTLFDWPSTGGGIHHAVEFAAALRDAGHEVRHFHAAYPAWGLNPDTAGLATPHEAIVFEHGDWNPRGIAAKFRSALAAWQPDLVFVLVSWNAKPWLAEAAAAWPYVMLVQGLETLCPLNNVRLLPGFAQCGRDQLSDPRGCRACVSRFGANDGLHGCERRLAEVGTARYESVLRRALAGAHAAIVMNPEVAAIVRPWTRQVVVSPAALDPMRFPWPPPAVPRLDPQPTVLFSGLVAEPIKGFETLRVACQALWRDGKDFVLAATGEGASGPGERIRWLGWQPPEALTRTYLAADLCAVPSRAQESFGRVAAEAAACGKPVVASRIGGLPFTVRDGVTGLLATAGDPADWSAKLARLIDDVELRAKLGAAGRQRFETEFSWPKVIARDIAPLLETSSRNTAHPKGSLS